MDCGFGVELGEVHSSSFAPRDSVYRAEAEVMEAGHRGGGGSDDS